MRVEYSTYEAKARFSEIIRQAHQGKTVTVSYRGEPVAEIRPFQRGPETVEERLAECEPPGGSSLVREDKDSRSRLWRDETYERRLCRYVRAGLGRL